MNAQPDIPPSLDRRPIVFSYTFLDTYENKCPYLAAQRYVYRTVKYVETPEMQRGNEVHAAFEHRIGGGKPLPLDMQQWESFATPFDGRGAKAEQKLAATYDGQACGYFSDKPQVWLRGKVDTNIINGTTGYIIDWKTGNSKYEDRFELDVGALLLKIANPQLERVHGQYAWLKDNRLGQMYDLSDFRNTWNKVHTIAAKVMNDKANGVFAKNQTPLCRWCELFTCEHNTNPKKP